MNKLYEYRLEIAVDPKYNKMKIYEYDIIAENETQWVYQSKYSGKYYIQEKKDKLYKKFHQKDWLWNVSFYQVVYYTTKKGKQVESIVKKALDKLVDETCFIVDIVKNTKIEFKEVC